MAALRVDVVSCCGFPCEHELTFEEADVDPQDLQAGLYMAGSASKATPPLPKRIGRVIDFWGPNPAQKTRHRIGNLTSLGSKTRSKHASIFQAQNETAFWAPYRNLIMRLDFRSHFKAAIWAQKLTAKLTPGAPFRARSEV